MVLAKNMDNQNLLNDPKFRKKIVELRQKNVWWNLKLASFFAVWAIIGYTLLQIDAWYFRLPCYILLGFIMHGIGVSVHESVHYLLANNRTVNNIIGFTAGLPLLLSRAAYKVIHLEHHAYTRQEGDPDELTNFTKNKRAQSILFYLSLLIVGYIYIFVAPFTALKLAKNVKSRLAIVGEYAFIIAFFVSVAIYLNSIGRLDILVNVWLIPYLFLGLTVNLRAIAEHAMTKCDTPLTRSRTVKSNRAIAFLLFNVNYHIEHHLFPGIPWYNLPKAHKLLLPYYTANSAHITKSYTKVLLDALRYGVHYIEPIQEKG
jgi:fatty acid desaturase